MDIRLAGSCSSTGEVQLTCNGLGTERGSMTNTVLVMGSKLRCLFDGLGFEQRINDVRWPLFVTTRFPIFDDLFQGHP